MNNFNSKKTHCKRGHELIPENLLQYELSKGIRSCKICFNIRNEKRQEGKTKKPRSNQNKLKQYCIRGHPLFGDNIRIDKNGKRICKECKRITARILGAKPETKSYKLNWQRNNRAKCNQWTKDWHKENPNYSKEWDEKNPELRKAIDKRHNAKPERKAYQKQWNRLNPRSGIDRPEDVRDSMMNTRIRNKNICQWFGCGRTPRQMSISVHHIFPIEEYPDLACIEQYQICYCAEHHYLWHKARGDDCQYVLKGAIKRSTYD